MIKTQEVKKQVEQKYTEIVEVKCDLCGLVHPVPRNYGDGIFGDRNWSKGQFGIESVKVLHEDGSHYPDSDRESTITSFDICPGCFKDKLVPWLQAQGAVPTIRNQPEW